MTELCVGILVGGAATRMGGVAKALLRTADGRTVLERVLHEVASAAPGASVVLLGNRQEYAALGLPQLADDPSGVGPLGGLRTLLRTNASQCLLLGGDTPYLEASLIARMLAAPCDAAVSVKTGNPPLWNPMLSRYRAHLALPAVEAQLAAGRYGLYALLDRLNASCLALDERETHSLRDWDTPADLRR